MNTFYTDEQNTQILISLMKQHGIRKIVASPGATNVCLVASLQQDPYFEIYSSVDERSAAYIACGLAAESAEPVALSCTGATASRNYIPGLTEAFYRKLPILAITSTQFIGRIGHNIAQVIDRSNPLNDIAKLSVQIPTIYSDEEKWACEIDINKALLELRHRGGGPVHINLTTTYSENFTVKELPVARKIERIEYSDQLPKLEAERVGVFVGAHVKWSDRLVKAVEAFCAAYNSVVFCDHTSGYQGRYRINPCLVCSQERYISPLRVMDVMIHIGDVSGAYIGVKPKRVWRVNPDGEIRDTFRKLSHVFEMSEEFFFEKYMEDVEVNNKASYLSAWNEECRHVAGKIPELPFSNVWLAQNTVSEVPKESVLHLGILNSLRSWNLFELPVGVLGYSNTGGFGIDGCVSSLIGASLSNLNKLYFGVVGDLAFFYDMNSIGNRFVGNNIRLMVVNNGKGTEFKNYNHKAARFGSDADDYMAAAGHFGNQSPNLIRHYAEDLGFEYLRASNKEEYIIVKERFFNPEITDRPMLLEVFTDSADESDALKLIYNIEVSAVGMAKKAVKGIVGDKGVKAIKKILKG